MIRIALLLLLTLLTASAQTAGPVRALSFDGTTADHVIVNNFSGFPSTAFTVEFWMRTSDTAKAGTPFSYAVSGEDNMFFIHDYRDLRFRFGGTAVPASGATGVAVNNGQWRHVAVTWTRTGGNLTLYVDGGVRYTASGVRTNLTIPSGGTLVLGQEQDSVGGGFETAEAFLGTMDEVRIWNVVRSSFNIRNDMHRSLTGTESGLVLYYRMDETTGNLVDASGDGHTGTPFGATRTSSTAPVGLPVTATTFEATSVSTVGVNFRGSVDPNGLAATAYFEYGTNGSQLAETARTFLSASAGPTAINRSQGGLRPSTTYFYRAVGSNALGERVGSFITFSTLGPPSVTTGPAVEVTSDSATLTATVNPRSVATTVYFQYGLTTNYAFTTGSVELAAGVSDLPASMSISGLIFDTNYQYRCVASNSFGITYGPNRTLRTQVFGDVGADLTAVNFAAGAWGDYDNDGDLDLILTGMSGGGSQLTQLLRNNGEGGFTPVSSGLPNVGFGTVAWGDFDNDGDLDLALGGSTATNSRISEIWRNDGNSFVNINAGLPGLAVGKAAWGDYDNDGDLDLALTGTTNGSANAALAQLWRNDGNGVFANANAGWPGVDNGAVAWGDYDNDGDLDVALTGRGTNGLPLSQIRRNDGNGTFTAINAGLQNLRDSSVAWGDCDNDGDLDLVLCGNTNGSFFSGVSQLWRNLGNGSFALVNAGIPRISSGAVAWGDYDNDGDLDLVFSGTHTNGNPLTELHSNNGTGTFSRLNANLPGIEDAMAAWGDYDNDGDLDLVMAGFASGGLVTHIRRNDSFPANAVPQQPANLSAAATISNAVFSWSPAGDAQTPSSALTYNIRVFPAVNEAPADPASGYHRLPALGNVQHGTNVTLVRSNFPAGTYYWTVQAIDSAFAGGPFAVTNIVEFPGRPNIIPMPPINVTTHSATLQALANPGGRNTSASFDFNGASLGDTNIGNGFSNILITAEAEGLAPDTVYQYRATALNVLGGATGADVSFRTLFFSYEPQALTIVLPPGAATNVSITLSNHLAAAVLVTNRFVAPAPMYAAVLNPTFTLGANATATVNLLIDASSLVADIYEATLEIVSGSTHAAVRIPLQLIVQAAEAADLTSVSIQPNGSLRLDLAGTSGYTQTVMASTNLEDWVAIGPATQISPGRFRFTDSNSTNFPQRFYQIRTP